MAVFELRTFYRVLLGFTGFYRVLLGSTGFYRVLPGFTWLYWVLLGFTGFYRVLLVFTGFNLVILGFTGFYWVLLGFTGFSLGFTGLYRLLKGVNGGSLGCRAVKGCDWNWLEGERGGRPTLGSVRRRGRLLPSCLPSFFFFFFRYRVFFDLREGFFSMFQRRTGRVFSLSSLSSCPFFCFFDWQTAAKLVVQIKTQTRTKTKNPK